MWVILFGYFYRILTLLTFGEVIGETSRAAGRKAGSRSLYSEDERH